MSRARPSRLGLRREVLIFLPAAIGVLLLLSLFTLASYRRSVERLAGERRQDAARLARLGAERLARPGGAGAAELQRATPTALAATLVTAGGEILATTGQTADDEPLRPLGDRRPDTPLGVGPQPGLVDRVAGFAPLELGGRRAYVRVDLPAAELAAERGRLSHLTLLVAGVDLAVLLLVLLFLRYLLGPYEILLRRARQVAPATEVEASDEAAFLIATFEQAARALLDKERAGDDEELAAVEQALAHSLRSALLLLAADGRLLAVNPIAAELLGLDAAAVGTPLAEALAHHGDLAGRLLAAAAGQEELERRELVIEGGGAPRTLGLTAHPLRRADGTVRGCLVLFADLTDEHRAAQENRLAESLAQLGELAAGVAHEMRNSLATLRGYLSLVERAPSGPASAGHLAELRHESDRLQRVLEDFLSFARPGRQRTEPVDLARVARRAAGDPALPAAAVVLRVETGNAVLPAGDPDLLERAVRNLLANAVAAQRAGNRPGEAVEMHVGEAAGALELHIDDRGPGIPPAVRERLFQPFVTGRPDGVGLGLALAHRIVALHGGSLRIGDRAGGGTRATIRFVLDKVATEGNNASPPPGSAPGRSSAT